MTLNKHFPNVIYADRNAKPEKTLACAGRQSRLARKIFMVAKIFETNFKFHLK